MGCGDTTSTVKLPKPTPEEKELLAINVQLAEAQLEAVGKQQRFQDLTYELAEMDLAKQMQAQQIRDEILSPEQQEEMMRAGIQREIRAGEVFDELQEIELERARLGGAASEEQKALIAEATENALALGRSDIQSSAQRSLGLLREELAPSMGLRAGDTPIQIRGQRIAEEQLRQEAQLSRGLRAGQAQAELNKQPCGHRLLPTACGLHRAADLPWRVAVQHRPRTSFRWRGVWLSPSKPARCQPWRRCSAASR
jgi:hypothetical protein